MNFQMTVYAFEALQSAGARLQSIPQGAGGYIPGNELYIPLSVFLNLMRFALRGRLDHD
jgi:hypothetical protein